MAGVQISVIGSGAEHEERAEDVGRLLAERGAVFVTGGRYGTLAEIGLALTLGRRVVVLEPGWDVDGTLRAQTPEDAVELALGTHA